MLSHAFGLKIKPQSKNDHDFDIFFLYVDMHFKMF